MEDRRSEAEFKSGGVDPDSGVASLLSVDELLQRTLDAKAEADEACKLDLAGRHSEAIQRYDQAVLAIDDVLANIANTEEEGSLWDLLIIFRQTYSDRMDRLREHLQNEIALTNSLRRQRRLSRVLFDEKADPSVSSYPPWESPPETAARHPYWIMRIIRTTVLTGGYLTPDVFVPKIIWSQNGVKFNGLQNKISAFENIMITLKHIYGLEYPFDIVSTEEAIERFMNFYNDLIGLQNNLAKPFPYIKEVIVGTSQTAVPTTQVGRLTSMFQSVGKNVFKLAEVGYQRLGSSMATRVSDDELAKFVALSSELCEKCQVLDQWIVYLLSERHSLISGGEEMYPTKYQPRRGVADELNPGNVDHISPTEGSHNFKHSEDVHKREMSSIGSAEALAVHIVRIEALLNLIKKVSAFMQYVFCEIMLRDLELLLARYLKKTRKSIFRMYWDVDDNSAKGNFSVERSESTITDF